AVDYARFRLLPPGRILGYEGMNPAAARKLVESSLQGLPREAPPLGVKGPQAKALLVPFGLPVMEVAPEASRRRVLLSLTVDPDFGPIWRFHRRGGASILRITPLTDLDIADVLARLELPKDCGLAETLGRLTQMVEELPWLHAFDAQVDIPPEGQAAPGPLPLLPGLRLSFAAPTLRMP
ncbi:MAG: hypothetical protein KGI56_11235, partial [Acidobacteriota bacterium]|nr:hypothetical protein [Acidobacteriota bacterium]